MNPFARAACLLTVVTALGSVRAPAARAQAPDVNHAHMSRLITLGYHSLAYDAPGRAYLLTAEGVAAAGAVADTVQRLLPALTTAATHDFTGSIVPDLERARARDNLREGLRLAAERSLQAGRPAVALAMARRAEALESSAPVHEASADPIVRLGLIHRLTQSPDSAIAAYLRAHSLLRAQGVTTAADDSLACAAAALVASPCAAIPPATIQDSAEAAHAPVLASAQQELGALLRERGELSLAAALLDRSLVTLAAHPSPVTRRATASDFRLEQLACTVPSTRAWCTDTLGSLALQRHALAFERFVGDVPREVDAAAALLPGLAAVDSGAAARLRDELAWAQRVITLDEREVASLERTAGWRRLCGDSLCVEPARLAHLTGAARARADTLRARGNVAGAADELLGIIRRIYAHVHNLPAEDIELAVSLARIAAMADLAQLYHRHASPRNLRAAIFWYDSASHAGTSMLSVPMPDAYRTTLAERIASVHGEWALALLARDELLPGRDVAAIGAIEAGRARVIQLLRGEGYRADDEELGGSFRNAGGYDGVLLDYAIVHDTLLLWAGGVPGAPGVRLFRSPIDTAFLLSASSRLRMAIEAGVAPGEPPRVVAERGLGLGGSEAISSAGVDSLAETLHATLLPPGLMSALGEGRQVLIIPDPLMGEVPFAVLRAAGDSVPLAMRHQLRFAPSLSLIGQTAPMEEWRPEPCGWSECDLGDPAARRRAHEAARAERRRWLSTAVIVGDPVMPRAVRADTRDTVTFRQLAGARAEARDVAEIVGTAPLIGAEATEARVRELVPGARLVHLATHGLAFGDPAHAGESFIALTAGAGHDGLLRAEEILADPALSLVAELVVLSACETAVGAANRGEGTLGLQRAFLARGARSVIVSQWQVPDAPTRILMEEFYRGWLDPDLSLSKTEALQRAQRIVRAMPQYAAPVNWAAFQLVGSD